MANFTLDEARALQYHRALVGLLRTQPDLIKRAGEQLERMRLKMPRALSIWQRWERILALPLDDLAEVVLEDSPAGGHLRANSPLGGALTPAQRNRIWRAIGMQQFVDFFLTAANDLGLSAGEQARVTGIDEAEISQWFRYPPDDITPPVLARLKEIVSIQRALRGLFDSMDARQAWLRTPHEGLGDAPLAVMLSGDLDAVREMLTDQLRPTLEKSDLPRNV